MNDLGVRHQTELRIDTQSIRHNLNVFYQLIDPSTEIMLMLKADAYGHDAVLLAKEFEAEDRISYYAVAYVDEGIRLRKVGIEKRILVLNPSENEFDQMIEHCLEPEIHNLHLLNAFDSFVKNQKQGMAPYPIHLKFNTGMNRLGFNENEIPEIIKIIKANMGIRTQSVMTHLSSTNLPEEDDFSESQLESFKRIIESTEEIKDSDTFYHCMNSNGIFRFQNSHYDLVRLGIGFYGTSGVPELRKKLKPASKLVSKICELRKVKKGDSISYSRSGRAPSDTQIATLSLGYADGLNRSFGNGNWLVEINGKLYPTIGNVCMDLTMIDVGNAELKIGDEAIIFGGQKSIYDFAEHLDTITYEVMCAIGPLVKRVLV